MPKIIRCDAANVGLDELADLLLERHFAQVVIDARFERGVGSKGGRLLRPQSGVDLCAQYDAGQRRNQTQNDFQSEPYASQFHGNTHRARFEAAFWGEDHTAMTALSNKGHSLCWSIQQSPILPMQRARCSPSAL